MVTSTYSYTSNACARHRIVQATQSCKILLSILLFIIIIITFNLKTIVSNTITRYLCTYINYSLAFGCSFFLIRIYSINLYKEKIKFLCTGTCLSSEIYRQTGGFCMPFRVAVENRIVSALYCRAHLRNSKQRELARNCIIRLRLRLCAHVPMLHKASKRNTTYQTYYNRLELKINYVHVRHLFILSACAYCTCFFIRVNLKQEP